MTTAVLVSGGLDSAVLLAEEAAAGPVQPIYVAVGLAWEAAERQMLEQFIAATGPAGPGGPGRNVGPGGPGRLRQAVAPLVSLSVDMRDVYPPSHWAIQGRPPGYHTADEDVYLHGRNIVLLGKAGVYCAAQRIGRIVLGTLDHNPFPDATPVFRSAMASALSLGLAHAITIDAPYSSVSKAEVIRRGLAARLPLELTLSCMNPTEDAGHCGVCSKCRERHDAFVEAGAPDPTRYASERFTSGTTIDTSG